ncbi:MAG: PAS domain-containing protein, partial [Bacteroidales bacterium]|nr:PAS domain-containing protein [Bacteroidales bacterium]
MSKHEISKEELMASAEALSASGSFEWDMRDDTGVYSPGILRIFDIPPGEHPNPSIIYSLVHPDDLPAFKEALDEVFAGQTSESPAFEFRITTPKGEIKHLWVRIAPEYNTENTLIRISGVVRDITVQKQQETLTDVIYNISRAASELDTSHELFSLIQQEIIRLIDASNMFVAYYNEKEDLLDIQYVTGEDDIKHLPAEGTMSKMVIRENKSLLIKEKEMDEMQARGEFVRVGKASKCWMGLPLRKGR